MANPTGPFWGGRDHEQMNEKEKKLIGCMEDWQITHEIRQIMIKLDEEMTAREMIQMFTGGEGYEDIPNPEKCEERAESKPNVYTDGSMLNPKGLHWSIGGLGIWWPGKQKAARTAEEEYFHNEQKNTVYCNGTFSTS